jgi:hypothetical protein
VCTSVGRVWFTRFSACSCCKYRATGIVVYTVQQASWHMMCTMPLGSRGSPLARAAAWDTHRASCETPATTPRATLDVAQRPTPRLRFNPRPSMLRSARRGLAAWMACGRTPRSAQTSTCSSSLRAAMGTPAGAHCTVTTVPQEWTPTPHELKGRGCLERRDARRTEPEASCIRHRRAVKHVARRTLHAVCHQARCTPRRG